MTADVLVRAAGSPAAVINVSPSAGISAGDSVAFDASDSTDPASEPLTYSWDFDADGVEDSNQVSASYTFAADGVYPVSLTVSDGTLSDTASSQVVVGDFSAPVPVIELDGAAPAAPETATAGDPVELEVTGVPAAASVAWSFGSSPAGIPTNERSRTYSLENRGADGCVLVRSEQVEYRWDDPSGASTPTTAAIAVGGSVDVAEDLRSSKAVGVQRLANQSGTFLISFAREAAPVGEYTFTLVLSRRTEDI